MKLVSIKITFSIVCTLALLPVQAAYSQITVNLDTFGGNGNGIVDNQPAFSSALSVLAASGGGELIVPPGDYMIISTNSPLSIPANTSIIGTPGSTILDFGTNGSAGTYRAFFLNNGNNIDLVGLTIRRAADFPCVMFPLQSYSGFALICDSLVGNEYAADPNHVQGLELASDSSESSDITISQSTLTGLNYGLYEASSSLGTVTGVKVIDSTFDGNYADDLEFNGPSGSSSNILVTGNTFENNYSTSTSSGFGVGMSNASSVIVTGNTFAQYNAEAIHIEDNTSNTILANNTITSAGLTRDCDIYILSGSTGISLTGNTIDASNNTDAMYMIDVLAGGAFADPTNITISSNDLILGAEQSGVGVVDTTLLNVNNNTVTRTVGPANAGYGIELYHSNQYTATGNVFSGLTTGLYLDGS